MALPLSIFETVKQQISTVEAAKRYLPGLKLRERGGRYVGLCPFHQDRMPSFVIFPDGRWKCFGCQENGDQVGLVAKALNLKPLEAARQIALDFGLPVDDQPVSPEARRRAEEAQTKREQERFFKSKVYLVYMLLAGVHRQIFIRLKTMEDFSKYGDLEALMLTIEPILDELQSGDRERQQAALDYASRWIA